MCNRYAPGSTAGKLKLPFRSVTTLAISFSESMRFSVSFAFDKGAEDDGGGSVLRRAVNGFHSKRPSRVVTVYAPRIGHSTPIGSELPLLPTITVPGPVPTPNR